MKAFGIRLAAGAATILLGAIMAAQGKKNLGDGSESARTAQSEPKTTTAQPIGSIGDLAAESPWADDQNSAEMHTAAFMESAEPSAVQLVQHVEDSGPLSLPAGTTESAPESPSSPQMTMSLPTFSDVETAATEAAGTVGIAAEEALGSFENVAEDFRDASAEFADQAADAFSNTSPSSDFQSPANDLRSGVGDMVSGVLDNLPQLPAPTQRAQEMNSQPLAVPKAMLEAVAMPGQDVLGQETGIPANAGAGGQSQLRINSNPNLTIKTPAPVADQAAPAFADNPAFTGNPAFSNSLEDSSMATMSNDPALVGNPGFPANAGQQMQPPPSSYVPPPLPTPGSQSALPSFSQSQDYLPSQTAPQMANPPLPDRSTLPSSQGFQGVPSFQGGPNLQGGQNALADPTVTGQVYNIQDRFSQSATMPGAISQAQPAIPARTATSNSGQFPFRPSAYQQPGSASDRNLPGPTLAMPGERKLEGVQQPSVVIQKRAPGEVKVGKQATFVLHVQNVGNSTAMDVQVLDRVPVGMKLVDATPRPDPSRQPDLFWALGDLQAGEERTITLQLVPEQEGELGSVARVTFEAAASVRTVSTRPELKIVQEALSEVLIGQQVEIMVLVSNTGTGDATGVMLQEDVPQGLKHPKGPELDYPIGVLHPNEERRIILKMQATEAGIVQNTIVAKADDGLETTHTIPFEIVAPKLQVALSGPTRRYLERQATFQVHVQNSGTHEATNVEIALQLDRGFTFVSTDYEGHYDPTRHAVLWALDSLPKGDAGTVPVTLLPVEEGERVLQLNASADFGVKASNERRVAVDSLAELTFSINDSADPVEIGGETTYEVRVRNTGSRDDSNVQVQLQLPPGMQLVGNGDFQDLGRGVIAFQPSRVLKANGEIVFTVKARGVAPGTHLVKAIVASDQSQTPVTKEESITVYADQ